MSSVPVLLSSVEAGQLAHALMQQIANDHGIRVLLIKGPTLSFHRLRPMRVSSDVDILVEPVRFADFCQLLQARGWVERPGIEALTVLHSRTFLHAEWPCDIDPHVTFPGFLADATDVFESLWARRRHLVIAQRPCAIPDRHASILIMALHALRSTSREQRHSDELAALAQLQLTDIEKKDLSDLAVRTGAALTARPALLALGVDAAPPVHEESSAAYREWMRRRRGSNHGAYPWLVAFRRGNARQRLQLVTHAFWPPEEELRRARPEIPSGLWGSLHGRLQRLARGISALPGGVALMVAERRRRR